jgi:hypothetical protein
VIAQKHEPFNPNDYDDGDYIIHFQGRSNQFMEYKFEHKKYGKVNWKIKENYENGKVVKRVYLDTNNRLKREVECAAPIVTYEYDDKGNNSKISYWYNEGKATHNNCVPFHSISYTFDAQKRVKTSTAYTFENKFITTIKYEYYDDSELVKKLSYHQENGELIEAQIAIVEFIYNKKGINIERIITNHVLPLPPDNIKSFKIKYTNKKMKVIGNTSTDFRVHTYYNDKGEKMGKMDMVVFQPPKKHNFKDLEKVFQLDKWLTAR